MSIRTDAIGQEIKIGDVVKPFAKSGHSTALSVVTKFNPVMIQVNGRDNYDADRLIVVSQNLAAIGKQNVVDDLQQQYASSLVHVDPQAAEPKVPVRYLVLANLANANDPKCWVVRFEGTTISKVRDVLGKSKRALNPIPTHVLRRSWKESSVYWCSANTWDVDRMALAWKSLPDAIAAVANGPAEIVELDPTAIAGIPR